MNYLIRLFLNAIAVLITSWMLAPEVYIENFGYAIVLAALLSVLNVSLKPLLILFTLPATILSFGLFLLVINTVIILVADWLLNDAFETNSFWWALLFSLVLSVLNSIFEKLARLKEKKEPDTKIYDKDGKRIA